MASSRLDQPFADLVYAIDEVIPHETDYEVPVIREPTLPPHAASISGRNPQRTSITRFPSVYRNEQSTLEVPPYQAEAPRESWLRRSLSRKESTSRAYARQQVMRQAVGPGAVDHGDIFAAFTGLASHDQTKFQLQDIPTNGSENDLSSQTPLIAKEESILQRLSTARYAGLMFALCLTFSLVSPTFLASGNKY